MNITIVIVDKSKNEEKEFVVGPDGREATWTDTNIEIKIVKE